MRHTRHHLTVILAMLIMLAAPLVSGAQDATPAADAPLGVLAHVEVDSLPSSYLDTRSTPPAVLPPAAEVWFLRITLDPDVLMPLGLQIGPTVIAVEAGAMTLETDQAVEITGSGAEPVIDADGTFITVVEAGQSAYVREDTQLQVHNEGDAQLTLLALLTFSPYREVEEMERGGPAEEPRGIVRQQPLGLTTAEFPEGPGVITIERIAFEAGSSETHDVPSGAVVAGIEQGSVTVSAASGMCYLWPGMLQLPTDGESDTSSEEVREPQRDEIAGGETAELGAGDAAGCLNGVSTWTAGEAGATVIRASVVPLDGESATPAG